ncbi:MAG: uroporphyrinogen-III C-methyltransferase [Thermoprotei archaeon]
MGKVYIIGAGPGDSELITLKAIKILRRADVVIYDRLVNSKILKHARQAKEFIYVGKTHGDAYKQEEINKLMIQKAKEHNIVVRLKNGDPFIFGRGGEECEALKEAGIEYEIIPGITSAIAAPEYAGIPLTHRNYASSVAIVTGHRKENKPLNLQQILKAVDTTVILMGISTIQEIIKQALDTGLAPQTPLAIIQSATTKRQKTIITTLQEVEETLKKHKIKPPAVIVIGKVAQLHKTLAWCKEK